MRKVMEKMMKVKKDGGQEVLITLGLVAIGVVMLVAFSSTGNQIIGGMLGSAKTKLTDLFGATVTVP